MGFSQGSAFGINGCKVADGGREDSNGLLTGFSLLGVSGEVFCDYLVVCEAFQLGTRHNTNVTSFGMPFPLRESVVAHAALTASTEAARASFLRWSKGL